MEAFCTRPPTDGWRSNRQNGALTGRQVGVGMNARLLEVHVVDQELTPWVSPAFVPRIFDNNRASIQYHFKHDNLMALNYDPIKRVWTAQVELS